MSIEDRALIERLPADLREPLTELITRQIERELRRSVIGREDFSELREIVKELAKAQTRTEQRVEELAQAQTRTEQRVEELAQAQTRTEQRLDRLEAAVEELTRVQTRFERTFTTQVGALGARWGLEAERSFRETLRAILKDVGFQVKRYLAYDEQGVVFDRPDQVELDVVIRDRKVLVLEIKSSVSRADVSVFSRKTGFYEAQEGVKVDRRIILSPFVEERARDVALQMGIEVYGNAEELAESDVHPQREG